MKASSTSERLKEIMAERGLKQVDILNKCKPFCDKYNVRLGRNDLSQYISGKVVPSQQKLTILAKGLNVDETWLMGYDLIQNDEKDRLMQGYANSVETAFQSLYMTMGYEYYKLCNVYHYIPSEGKTELLSYTDYLMNKYSVQEKFFNEDEIDEAVYPNLGDYLNGNT